MSRKASLAVAAVVFGLVLWKLWPKAALTPEDQIRALVARCVDAAERRDVGVIHDAMAEGFRGPQGASRDEVRSILFGQLFRNRELAAIFNPRLEVKLEGPDRAAISGTFVFARAKAKQVEALPEGGVLSSYRIDATLALQDGQWRFTGATSQGD